MAWSECFGNDQVTDDGCSMITDEIIQEEQVEWPHGSSLGLNLCSPFQQTFTVHLGKAVMASCLAFPPIGISLPW